MKLLQDILYRAGIIEIRGYANVAIEKISFDSRDVNKLTIFTAIRGSASDGHQFIPQVIEKGVPVVVCEEFPEETAAGVTYIKVADSRSALARMASNFYDNPSSRLKLVGVTGTNGKTTVATTLYELFTLLGYKCGLLSTIRNRIGNEIKEATHTTPDPVKLNKLLAEMVQAKCQYAFMEVSSHALDQKRVEFLEFKGAVFTNITHDHLDYHKTFEHYLYSKKILFDTLPTESFALINADDKNGKVMVQNTKAKVYTYSLRSGSDHKARIIENHISGLHLTIDSMDVHTRLAGEFNAYNLLAVYATAVYLGQDKLNVLTALSSLKPVEGRFQIVNSGAGVTGIVDYAHTPDALLNVLKTVKHITRGQQKIVTVVGCGGNRDKAKRPVMAKVAAEWSDKVILTSDNPRDEEPQAILDDMRVGLDHPALTRTLIISDRREAIRTACSLASGDDVILVAGKGHEKYQEIKGVKHHFDDVEILETEFKLLNAKKTS